jgi:hypothetical protein
MARKTETFSVTLTKNTLVERGGAWLLGVRITLEGEAQLKYESTTAWANPSAAKRYVKTLVEAHTPRKSCKLTATKTDDAGKPLQFVGEINYKEVE